MKELKSNTVIWIAANIDQDNLEEKSFTFGQIFNGEHVAWCKEQQQGRDGDLIRFSFSFVQQFPDILDIAGVKE